MNTLEPVSPLVLLSLLAKKTNTPWQPSHIHTHICSCFIWMRTKGFKGTKGSGSSSSMLPKRSVPIKGRGPLAFFESRKVAKAEPKVGADG